MSIKKPMLAGSVDNLNSVSYPVLCTPKLDGIRCVVVDGHALSRNFKPIPNRYIRGIIEQEAVDGFDGEIIVKGKQFSGVSSSVMSKDGRSDFSYTVFDYCVNPLEGYKDRMKRLSLVEIGGEHIERLFPKLIVNTEELLSYETKCLTEGYEGVMLRSINSPYKFGRSTLREGWLLKLKRFTDSEAVILDIYEQMTNQNEAELDVFGYTKRSSHQDGKFGNDTLGGFVVRDIKSEVQFKIGTGDGLNNDLRKKIWKNQKSYIGKVVKYKSQKSGEKDKPRFPVFLGFRDSRDM